MTNSRSSLLLLCSLLAAASGAALLNCSADAAEEEEALTEDDITGVNNSLGLALVYDKDTSKVKATLGAPLGPSDKLLVRVRRGTITHDSQKNLDCSSVPEAPKTGARVAGKVVYEGPSVSRELVDLLAIYNDPRWYGGHETPEMLAEIAKGPDSIVEACVVRNGKVRAKLLTNLAYAWDRGEDLKKAAGGSLGGRALHIMATDAGEGEGGVPEGDGGVEESDAGAGDGGPAEPTSIPEGASYNTIDYAKLCVQELGEIPFFKKLADGKYESFDCRDFVGSHGDEPGAAVEGVEGAVIPLSVDGVEQTKCSEGRSSERSYDCVDKCDEGMYLTASSHTGLGRKAACQPGVTVTSAKNAQGTSWVLLCRKVEDTGPGMMQTKRFNDIAIIGNNPRTGQTCFFQNKENVGNDGSKVVHPADVARSSAIWPATPSSYCTKNCHAADAFVHSPWIDRAKKADGKTIVPKMGEHPDYLISNLEMPYRLINGSAQGFSVPKQLVSEGAAACTTCHRVAGKAFAEFAEWSTGKGDAYFQKITDSHKTFPQAFWMPPRLDGLTAENFAESRYGKAVAHIRKCMDNESDPECEFADVPTGR
jgi:hypothetical protein